MFLNNKKLSDIECKINAQTLSYESYLIFFYYAQNYILVKKLFI